MNRAKKERLIAAVLFAIILICYVFALVAHDMPSYEQDSLKGTAWFLHWSMVLYIPIYPLVSMMFSLFVLSQSSARSMIGVNFLLTLMTTIIACVMHILAKSWLFFTAANLALLIGAIYDDIQQGNEL